VTDEVETLAGISGCRRDLDRIGDHFFIGVVFELGRIGPRARRIAALIGRDGAVARRRQPRQRAAPAVPRFGKAMQQQHEVTASRARDIRGECEARLGLEFGGFGHTSQVTPFALNQARQRFQPSSAASLR